ncbi:MAG: hypothetical protein JW741_21165 [Sedimentisphaerales bacterium]|nr:hypothetical protein [Sedimentisphaerales bacterium]
MDWNGCLEGAFSDLFARRKLFLLLLFWTGGLGILFGYGTRSAKFIQSPTISGDLSVFGENDTGAFFACRTSAEAGRSPYRVEFDNLRVDDGSIGLFRTAAHKVVQIENLRVTFSPPAAAAGASGAPALGEFYSLFAPQRDNAIGGDGLGLFHDLQGAEGDVSISIDLADTTEVRIRGLTWEIHHGGATLFRARCRDARLYAGSNRIMLRGHVTLTAHGRTLESNCLELDMQSGRIIANTRYILTRDGHRQFGMGTCFDAALKKIGATS